MPHRPRGTITAQPGISKATHCPVWSLASAPIFCVDDSKLQLKSAEKRDQANPAHLAQWLNLGRWLQTLWLWCACGHRRISQFRDKREENTYTFGRRNGMISHYAGTSVLERTRLVSQETTGRVGSAATRSYSSAPGCRALLQATACFREERRTSSTRGLTCIFSHPLPLSAVVVIVVAMEPMQLTTHTRVILFHGQQGLPACR